MQPQAPPPTIDNLIAKLGTELGTDEEFRLKAHISYQSILEFKRGRYEKLLKRANLELLAEEDGFIKYICNYGVQPKARYISGKESGDLVIQYTDSEGKKTFNKNPDDEKTSDEETKGEWKPCANIIPTRAYVDTKTIPDATEIKDHPRSQAESKRNAIKQKYLEIKKALDKNDYSHIPGLIEGLQDFKKIMDFKNRRQHMTTMVNLVSKIIESMDAKSILGDHVSLNFILTGPPGVGKTQVCKSIAKIFAGLGILSGELIETSAADFIGEYAGKTAIKTRAVLVEGLDRVTLLDEAYALVSGSPGGYGDQAINEMIQFLSSHEGEMSLIAAGYKNLIQTQFIDTNPGLIRRFRWNWDLGLYTGKELWNILQELIKATGNENIFNDTIDSKAAQMLLMLVVEKGGDTKGFWSGQAGNMVALANELKLYTPITLAKMKELLKAHVGTVKFIGKNESKEKVNKWIDDKAEAEFPVDDIIEPDALNQARFIFNHLDETQLSNLLTKLQPLENISTELKEMRTQYQQNMSKETMITFILTNVGIALSAAAIGAYIGTRRVKVTNNQLYAMLGEMMTQQMQVD
jgi:hypothetical protein